MDPKDFKGVGPEADDLSRGLVDKRGVYVLRASKLPVERQGEDDIYLESLSNPASDAFVRLGFEEATDEEAKAYRERATAAKQAQLDSLRKESPAGKALADAEQTKLDASKPKASK